MIRLIDVCITQFTLVPSVVKRLIWWDTTPSTALHPKESRHFSMSGVISLFFLPAFRSRITTWLSVLSVEC